MANGYHELYSENLLGNFILKSEPKDYKHLDVTADDNPEYGEPQLGELCEGARAMHPFMPKWTYWPDYEQVRWINSIVQLVWPKANVAVCDTVLTGLKPTLQDVVDQYWFIGNISIEAMDLGKNPIKIGGIKAYECRDDEAMLETPIQWGSDAVIRISVTLKLGPLGIYVPIEIRNIQAFATARIGIRPLVETLPCLGALSISLLELPHVDLSLYPFGFFDIMAIPGVKQIVDVVIGVVLKGLVLYPVDMTFPIMENGGVPKPPAGMLEVALVQVDNITAGGELLSKVDPFLKLSVREGREQKTKTVENDKNPKYGEIFHFIVDDLDTQNLKLDMFEDDVWKAELIGEGDVWFISENDGKPMEFIEVPRKPVAMAIPLYKPNTKGMLAAGAGAVLGVGAAVGSAGAASVKGLTKSVSRLGRKGKEDAEQPAAAKATAVEPMSPTKRGKVVGTAQVELTYYPFYRPDDDDEFGDEGMAVKKMQASAALQQMSATQRGVITLTLIRAHDLAAPDGDCNPYVVLQLSDPTKDKPEIQKSTQLVNDNGPRWGQKFDFVDISVQSMLYVTVYSKSGMFEGAIGGIKGALGGKKQDKLLGRLRIPIKDVARNTRLKDQFALQEAQQGVVDLKLEWQSVEYE